MVQGFSGCRTLVTLLMHQIIDKILSVFRPGAAEHLHQDVSNSKNVDRKFLLFLVKIEPGEHHRRRILPSRKIELPPLTKFALGESDPQQNVSVDCRTTAKGANDILHLILCNDDASTALGGEHVEGWGSEK